MTSSRSVNSTACNVEIFCHMLFEEFLTTNNMQSTLQAFRKEWERPAEDITMFSWYNLILKLQISDLLHQKGNGRTDTVLESIVKALAQESSIRTRRPLDVTLSNMVSMPKSSTLPTLSETLPAQSTFELKTVISTTKVRQASSSSGKLMKNNADNALISPKLDRLSYTKGSKTSAENWLPDTFRLKSRLRDLATVQTTLDEVIHSELDSSRRQKRTAMNAYDKALNEESLSMVKKHPCGCCLQKYLYVNLPLKVSRKAIIDIRVKWTGGMTSANMFSGTRSTTAATSSDPSVNNSTLYTADASYSPQKLSPTPSYPDLHMLRSPVSMYDQVLVCLFCSQFFQSQEEYRPSYAEVLHKERKANHLALLEQERQYWDPLMMMDKDKIEEELEKERLEFDALLATSSSYTADNISNARTAQDNSPDKR